MDIEEQYEKAGELLAEGRALLQRFENGEFGETPYDVHGARLHIRFTEEQKAAIRALNDVSREFVLEAAGRRFFANALTLRQIAPEDAVQEYFNVITEVATLCSTSNINQGALH